MILYTLASSCKEVRQNSYQTLRWIGESKTRMIIYNIDMRNWEQEQIIKRHLLGCYVEQAIKDRIKALARARRISISALMRELIELALPQLELVLLQPELAPPQPELAPPQLDRPENQHDLGIRP